MESKNLSKTKKSSAGNRTSGKTEEKKGGLKKLSSAPTVKGGAKKLDMEARKASITEEALTPIVLSQLQTATKLKEEARKNRRGSRSSQSGTPVVRPALPLDSGSESCGEESRKRTAEAFMSGIQSALGASMQDLGGAGASASESHQSKSGAGLSAELIGEVDSVLAKLKSSLSSGDPSLIPLITNLQTSLQATAVRPSPTPMRPESQVQLLPNAASNKITSPTSPRTPTTPKEWMKDPFGALPKRPLVEDSQQEFEPRQAKTFDPNIRKFESELPAGEEDDEHVASKIPWKIRAARKRAMKHHTTGMTKDEFAEIKKTLTDAAVKLAPKPKETSYNLSRNKSESAIRRGDLPDADDCLDTSLPSTYQQVEGNRAYGNVNKSTEVLYQQSDLGYASDVCDYNIAKSKEDKIRSAESKLDSRSLKTRSLQQDDSYVHQVRPSSMSGASSVPSERREEKEETEDVSKTLVNQASDILNVTNVRTPHNITQMDTLTPHQPSVHFSENNSTVGSETTIVRGKLEQQSSTEDDRLSSGSRSPRKNSKSSSGVRAKIARRKLMKQVNNNTLDVPHGSLSDQENLSEQNEDSVEEKHDSEPIDDVTSKKNKVASRSCFDSSQEQNKLGSQLTPEMARKDWNSRFSNLKSSFDAASEEELSGKSRSPSMNRTEPILQSSTTESRGRSRFKEKLGANQRSRSAHNINSGDVSTSERFVPRRISSEKERKSPVERAPSKEDKNKLNALTARSASNSSDNRDDEYAQYLETVNKMRANNQRIMAQAWVNRQQLQKENNNMDPFQRRSYQGPLIPTQLKPTQPVVPMTRNSSNTVQVAPKSSKPSEKQPPESLPNRQRPPETENNEPDQRPVISQVNSVSKEVVPEDANTTSKRKSKSLPKENVPREFDEESQAEILGFVKAQDNEPIAKSSDMDYQEYMNIINRVRKTKEFTRIRTEQYRLASMYAQEKKRQEELRQEEERLRKEREQYEREKSEVPIITTVASLQAVSSQPISNSTRSSESNSSLQGLEKGQLDNKESEQKKISPSPIRVLDNKEADSTPKVSPQRSVEVTKEENLPSKIPRPPQPQPVDSENQEKLERIRQEHIRQQQIREEQVRSEQEKLAKLREEQLKQEKEREEILRLEYERLQQIREEHRHLEEERRRQEEQYMNEQMRLEEERRKQEKLQAEKNAEYNRQRLDMEARHFAKANRERNVSHEENLSQEDLFYNERIFQQDKLREAHRKEETQIRQEKLNLIKQEEMLIQRQEDMLKQIEAERENLTKQEDLIRSRQQERLQQVRREKMLLEKQEEMLQMREQQLMQERLRYEELRKEQRKLREQEESIRKRQEEISKELLSDFSHQSPEIMVCQAREGQVFQGPHAERAVVIPALTDSSILDSDGDLSRTTNTSTNSMSFNPPNLESIDAATFTSKTSPFSSSSGIGTLSNIPTVEPEEQLSEGSSDEDTLDEEDGYYESKVEVQQNQTSIPTSVRTIETKLDNAPWAQITPYLTYSEEQKRQFQQDEINAIFSEAKNFVQPGVITSPESTRTSTNLITTPDGSWSLQSQASQNDAASLSSSCAGSPPPIPPLPLTDSDEGSFYPVQPEVPPRTDSYAVTKAAISTSVSSSSLSEVSNRRSLIEMPQSSQSYGPLLSPRLGGPGSAFKPYASNENLHDPSNFSIRSPDTSGSELLPPTTNYALMRNGDVGGMSSKFKQPVYGKVKELRRPLVAAFSTTDTEPEMRECKLPPHDAKGKRRSKMIPSYSTSETEEEYLAYMRARPKWHGKGGHKDSWDPLVMQSPPQITQKPVGVIQKPKPHIPPSLEDTSFISSEVPSKLQPEPVAIFHQPVAQKQAPPVMTRSEQPKPIVPQPGLLPQPQNDAQENLLPPNMERIQKSDSIIELREKPSLPKSAAGDTSAVVQAGKHQVDQDAVLVPITVTEINKRFSLPIQQQQSAEGPIEKEEVFVDPLEKRKKELHQKLMNETLMKVEQKKDSGPARKFNNSGIQRTNPTIAAMEIMTRKELKMSEMEERLARGEAPASLPLMNVPKRNQVVEHAITEKPKPLTEKPSDILIKRPVQSPSSEMLKKVETSSKALAQPPSVVAKSPRAPQSVQNKEPTGPIIKASTEGSADPKADNLPSPRILRQPTTPQKSPLLSKQKSLEIPAEARPLVKPHPMMAAAVKKFESDQSMKSAKPEMAPKPRSVSREPEDQGGPPVIILKKQPKRLDPEEIRARKNSAEKKTETKEPEKKLSREEIQQKVNHAVKDQAKSVTTVPARRKSVDAQKSDSELVRKPIIKQEGSLRRKEKSQELVLKEPEDSDEESSQIEPVRHETVRKAAERFEREAQLSSAGQNPSGFIGFRERSKSIGNNLGQVITGDHPVNIPKAFLPWASAEGKVEKPMSAVKRRDLKNKGYALRMSKSSDSITAAKLLAQQRQANNERGLRINQNMSKSIERQIDVYSKTRDDIRRILSMAKTCSVSERVNLFDHELVKTPIEDNREEKAKAIRKEIEEAKAKSMSEASGDDIEFQAPVESKVKPLKIPMKTKFVDPEKTVSKRPTLRINQSDSEVRKPSLRINKPAKPSQAVEDESFRDQRRASIENIGSVKSKIESYLQAAEETGKETEAPSSPAEIKPKSILVNKKNKTPKLLHSNKVPEGQMLHIYAQSATDYSAEEEEEFERFEKVLSDLEGRGGRRQLSKTDPGPDYLQVPKNSQSSRGGNSFGLAKSKSFGSPGQFECGLEADDLAKKTETIMAFFGTTKPRPKHSPGQRGAPPRRSSITSISDEILGDEDLQDVDEVFESLLHNTFSSGHSTIPPGQRRVGGNNSAGSSGKGSGSSSRASFGKVSAAGASAGSRPSQSRNSVVSQPQAGADAVLQQRKSGGGSMMVQNQQQNLERSRSFGNNAAIASAVESRRAAEDAVFNARPAAQSPPMASALRQKNFDPVAALPTSHTKKYLPRQQTWSAGSPPPVINSPSPTQSEYETADPWDDY